MKKYALLNDEFYIQFCIDFCACKTKFQNNPKVDAWKHTVDSRKTERMYDINDVLIFIKNHTTKLLTNINQYSEDGDSLIPKILSAFYQTEDALVKDEESNYSYCLRFWLHQNLQPKTLKKVLSGNTDFISSIITFMHICTAQMYRFEKEYTDTLHYFAEKLKGPIKLLYSMRFIRLRWNFSPY